VTSIRAMLVRTHRHEIARIDPAGTCDSRRKAFGHRKQARKACGPAGWRDGRRWSDQVSGFPQLIDDGVVESRACRGDFGFRAPARSTARRIALRG
jgi:hypothetical protein